MDGELKEYNATLTKYLFVAATTILYHDYCLTFWREYAWVWCARQKISTVNILFYLNRYVGLFGQTFVLIRTLWIPSDGLDGLKLCVTLQAVHQYLAVLMQLIVGVMLILRTYALYHGNRWVLGILVTIGAAVLANGVWSVTTGGNAQSYRKEDLTVLASCILPADDHNARQLAIAWAGLLVMDVLIFGMTLHKSLQEVAHCDSTIMRILLRDGAIYFGAMSLASIASVVSFLVLPPYARGNITSIGNVLSSTLMSRLLLNLRDPTLCSRFVPDTNMVLTNDENDDPIITSVYYLRSEWVGEPVDSTRNTSEDAIVSNIETADQIQTTEKYLRDRESRHVSRTMYVPPQLNANRGGENSNV